MPQPSQGALMRKYVPLRVAAIVLPIVLLGGLALYKKLWLDRVETVTPSAPWIDKPDIAKDKAGKKELEGNPPPKPNEMSWEDKLLFKLITEEEYAQHIAAKVILPLRASDIVRGFEVEAGTKGYVIWSAPVQIETRRVLLKKVYFRVTESRPTMVLSEARLYIHGVDVGQPGFLDNEYIRFDLDKTPISLLTGSHPFELRADFKPGWAGHSIQVSIQRAEDLIIYDPLVGANCKVTGWADPDAFRENSASKLRIVLPEK
jgi:hypothetical protein